jgi:hypothetical protein
MSVSREVSDLAKLNTVAALREMIDSEFGKKAPSKLRKIELANYLLNLRAIASVSGPEPVATFGETAADANAMLAGALYMAGTEGAAGITPEERRELNEAKYRGRYAGKAVTFVHSPRKGSPISLPGVVVDRTHRDADPQNLKPGERLMLLAIKWSFKGMTRVTLHAAEDVTVSR